MKKLIAGLLLALTMAPVAHAGEVFVLSNPINDTNVALYSGNVEDGDSKKLAKLLDNNEDVKIVYLMSPGGSAYEAFEISKVLNLFDATAYVPEGFFCLSACGEALLGANDYKIDGVVGFHRAWVNDYVAKYNDGFKDGQQFGNHVMRYRAEQGFTLQLSTLIGKYTDEKTFITFFNEDDLDTFKSSNLLDEIEIDDTWKDFHIMTAEKMIRYMQ